jgi:3D (Asp-Asp-Asp) domain-containing protein
MKAFYLAPLLLAVIGGVASTKSWDRPVQGVDMSEYVSNCSDGWRITGYFTPIENDYTSTETSEVDVVGLGKMSFNADFLRVVFSDENGFGEGWGKTRFGWYLGNYNGRWHKSTDPLDANNSPLKPNSVAVDNALIPNGSVVTVPGLPDGFGKTGFIANDVGVTVHGKHIDVYTGEGKAAEHEMDRVTFEDDDELQRVCFQRPQDNK